MTLELANKLIQSCVRQMTERYIRSVFDEWAIVSLSGGIGRILSYSGPRKAGFQRNFSRDLGALKEGVLAEESAPGDYDFSRHEPGTGFECYMVLGPGTFLICNNTGQSMDAIASDSRWLSAQVPFVELSECFRADPLLLVSESVSASF
jgi:hypothetical protein